MNEPLICHTCKKELVENEEFFDYNNGFVKCKACHQSDPVLRDFQPCQVYSRIVGYYSPVDKWNKGKLSEMIDRVEFKIKADQL